jgi:tetratricopeptide (TPR) repeat protein
MPHSARRSTTDSAAQRGAARTTTLLAALLLAAVSTQMQAAPVPANVRAEAIRHNNLGTARMNQQRYADAAQEFAAALRSDPSLTVAAVNEGIALLFAGNETDAAQTLHAVIQHDPGNPRAWYCLGLLDLRDGKTAQAADELARAATLAPDDADAHYMHGRAELQLGHYAQAEEQFSGALRLNPLDASAEYGLAAALQHQHKTAEARVHLRRFQDLTSKKLSTPFSGTYGESGDFALVQSIHPQDDNAPAMIPVRFSPQMQVLSSADHFSATGALCIVELDPAGAMDIVALGSGKNALRIYKNDGHGHLTPLDAAASGLSASGTAVACAVGDYNHDSKEDLAIAFSDRVALYKNLGGGKFADVTHTAGIAPRNHPSALTFVDYDHDGDLDLLVTGSASRTGAANNVLWRNNGDGTFTEWTAPTGLGGAQPASGVELSDINNDRAVDLLTTGAASAPTLYLNPRDGVFPAQPLFTSAHLPPTRGIAVLDFNKDGWMDVAVTHAGAPGVTLWRNVDGKRFVRVPLPIHGATEGWGITPIDIDNDGWLDLAVLLNTAQGPQLHILRNLGAKGFADVTRAVHLDTLKLHAPRTLLAADFAQDGAAGLIVGQQGAAPLLLRNVGGNKNYALRIRLHGAADNTSALGTKVEVFAGTLWQKWEIPGASGYLGQGPSEVLAGIGQNTQADIVRLLWPTGVPQDEIGVAAGAHTNQPVQIQELDRRGSSCPTLFAWDGNRYQFVSDVIGAAVIGHWMAPGRRNTPDPDEWIKIDGSQMRPFDGRFSLRFGEPMEEVNYIDQVRLIAVDHPLGTQVNADEKFLSEPPFASGKILLSEQAHPLAGAWDSTGRNVLPLLSARDHQYVSGFTQLHYDGFANLHALTLDLGPWSPRLPLRLLMHGYVNYFSASSMYAAWQAGLHPIPPYVEAQMPDGHWQRVVDDMGFPAGLPRTIVADLTGKLPPGTQRIRILTNLQIYWDQILVDNEASPSSAMRITELPLDTATLAFRGYPQQIEGASPGEITYNYNRISQTGPFVRQRGQYTRYGDVTPLLRSIDDRFVIFGSGEDMDLEFRASPLPTLPQGWTRDYFFYANGYVKDMDFYEASPFTVTDLPYHAMHGYPYTGAQGTAGAPERTGYQLDWNSRYESGNHPRPYVFDYQPSVQHPPAPGTDTPIGPAQP